MSTSDKKISLGIIFTFIKDFALIILLGLMTWAGNSLIKMGQTQAETVTTLHGVADMLSETKVVVNRNVDEIGAIKEWKAGTTANRFTASDGKEVWKEIAAIRESLAALPTEVPPSWFVKRVDSLEARLCVVELEVNHHD